MTKKLQVVPRNRVADIIVKGPTQEWEFDFDEKEVLRLMGGSAANGDNKDPVVFQGGAEKKVRAIVDKYGFERLPETYAEFQGLTEYCSTLALVVGDGIVKSEQRRKEWIATAVGSWERMMKEYVPAGKLYAHGDIEGLRAYHRENDILTLLGKRWKEEF